jgi:DNA-binding protein HU-beta
MTKDELIAKISGSTGLRKTDLQKAFDVMIQTIIETTKAGGKVNLTGLGIFKVKDRKARTARNPKTGEPVPVPAKRAPKFLPAKNYKEAVK